MSTQNHYLDLITRLGGKKVAVIGDIMLDRSLFGVTERFSAEAPIPIVDVKSKVEQLGGAANVANNLRALGDIPILFSVVGDDQDGKILSKLVEQEIQSEHFIFRCKFHGICRNCGRWHMTNLIVFFCQILQKFEKKVEISGEFCGISSKFCA